MTEVKAGESSVAPAALLSATEVYAAETRELGVDPRAGIAVALSGGGVRSAAFCLGALEELERVVVKVPPRRNDESGANGAPTRAGTPALDPAEAEKGPKPKGTEAAHGPRLLDHVHYLSTVSGGGFTGALWMLLADRGIRLTSADARPHSERARTRASYLAPGSFFGPSGLFEGAASYLIGVALNLVKAFAVAGAVLAVYAMFARLAHMKLGSAPSLQMLLACVTFASIGVGTVLAYSHARERNTWVFDGGIALVAVVLFLFGVELFVGRPALPPALREMDVVRALLLAGVLWALVFAVVAALARASSRRSGRPSATLRIERRRRLGLVCMVLLGLGVLVLETSIDPLGLERHHAGIFEVSASEVKRTAGWVVTAMGGYAAMAGALGFAVDRLRQSPGVARPILSAVTACGAVLALVLLAVAHAAIFDVLERAGVLDVGDMASSGAYVLACVGVVVLVQLVLTLLLPDATTTHHLFRDRIAAAFFPADTEDSPEARKRRQLHYFASRRLPFWIINAALNDPINSEHLPRGQRAVLFTYTPLFCGADASGYGFVRTERYGFKRPPVVAQALTTSAAVVAPKMGEYSAFWIWVVANLLNLQLGVNARRPFRAEGQSDADFERAWPVLAESPKTVAALLDDWLRRSWLVFRGLLPWGVQPTIYLTDGGHYDNLGILTLISRRCRYVIAIDGEHDTEYACQGLADVVRKARIHHDTIVQIDLTSLARSASERARFAVGTMRYPDGETGYLLYLKAVVRGDEPADVRNHGILNPDFPQEPTANQFFSSSQFEAYRSLGAVTVSSALGAARPVLDAEPRAKEAHDPGAWLERLFEGLKWSRAAPGMAAVASFHQSSERWLDLLKDGTSAPALGVALIDPLAALANVSPAEARASLAIFQHMENVFFACRLGSSPYADDNAGWMRLFRRYAESPALRAVWPHAAGYFSDSFRRFCDAHLRGFESDGARAAPSVRPPAPPPT